MPTFRECGAHVASSESCPICFHKVCRSQSPDGKLRCTRTAGHSGAHENGWVKPAVTWLAGVVTHEVGPGRNADG